MEGKETTTFETRAQSEDYWRGQIAQEIMKHQEELLKDAKELGPDAYLVASRTIMACIVVARGLMK